MCASEYATPLLTMRGISKTFAGMYALADVEFTARSGEIHALMGENGAGKSTLLKVLTGVYARDAGTVLLEGQPFYPGSPAEAQDLGVSTVYQEVNLIPQLSVAENICLGRQPGRLGLISRRGVRRRAEAALERLGLKLDVSRTLSAYSIAIQQMVAIARALDVSARLLVLDEPTSSLDAEEVRRLFYVMRKLRAEGLGIVFVTHFLEQVYEVTDRITVLRNGRLVGEYVTAELPRLHLVAHMLGKGLAAHKQEEQHAHEQRAASTHTVPLLEVRGASARGWREPFDLSVRCGEVMGLAGLLGSGRTEVARLLFGVDAADRGSFLLDGKAVSLSSPRQAIRRGFGFSSEDRKTEGIVPELSVRENMILALQARRGWLRKFPRKQQQQIADRYIAALNIATSNAEKRIGQLSGGNQQKVLLARWLACDPRFLILDEPTRGIDIGAKAEIEKLTRELCEKGMALLFISSELDEVLRCSNRIAVMRDRRKVAEISAEDATEAGLMSIIAEGSSTPGQPHA
ncbi:MAG: sugar ABC transporter ATP-binding protein [Candidatus Sumerlaeaceae bacterium]